MKPKYLNRKDLILALMKKDGSNQVELKSFELFLSYLRDRLGYEKYLLADIVYDGEMERFVKYNKGFTYQDEVLTYTGDLNSVSYNIPEDVIQIIKEF